MTSDTATDPTPSGPVPAAKKRAAKAAAAPKTPPAPTVDAGQRLLDLLAADDLAGGPTDPLLYARGCVESAIAMHISPDKWIRVTAYNHPDADNTRVTTYPPISADIEILAVSIAALDEIAGALPWTAQPITQRETDRVSGRTHVVTRGVLWNVRVAVAAIEPVPAADVVVVELLGGAR